MSNLAKLKVLDLFSGIGGFSLGLERAGMDTVAFCEVDEFCRKVLKKHWPHVPIHDDVKKLHSNHIKEPIDVITAGFPCQDISCANIKGDGLGGEKSGLWSEVKRLMHEISPRYGVFENVPNIRARGFATVLKDLWSIGYDCEYHVIPAASIDQFCPHSRERIWILAHPHGTRFKDQYECHERTEEEQAIVGCSSNLTRLFQRPFWEKEKMETVQGSDSSGGYSQRTLHWESEPPVFRVDDGLSPRLDKIRRERVKSLGNSIVPQIAELIGHSIQHYEETGEGYTYR